MTTEQIKEYNNLCAEFLGARRFAATNEYELYGLVECLEDGENEQHFFEPKDMLFHSDWNWIMEMVEAIEKMGYWVEVVNSNLGTAKRNYPIIWCEIGKENHTNLLLDDCYERICRAENLEGNKREAVVQAIYLFLKWYKEQKL